MHTMSASHGVRLAIPGAALGSLRRMLAAGPACRRETLDPLTRPVLPFVHQPRRYPCSYAPGTRPPRGQAMRTLGLIGGMSWESTAEYYRLLNGGVAHRLGGLHSAPLLLHSVDFAEVAALQERGDWTAAGTLLADAARGLERAGAEALLLCTNTMHYVADAIQAAVGIPLLHIVDATCTALHEADITRAGLLGTRYTMELPFWRERLRARSGLELLVPDAEDRATVHRVIFDELVRGTIRGESRTEYVRIIERLAAAGAEAVVLGCTEIGLLIRPSDSPIPVFDTTALHVAAALDFCVPPRDDAARTLHAR
jgi:aspartate racemase